MTTHGTISKYTSGCRCQQCRQANAAYQRAYQAKRKGSDTTADWPFVIAPQAGQPAAFITHTTLERAISRVVTSADALREAIA